MLVFLFGFTFGFIIFKLFGNSLGRSQMSQDRLGGYKYIKPLLECNIENENKKELVNFKNKVEENIHTQIEEGNINEAAMYFRDLNNGPWIGLNEQTEFAPASLLKVPLMMSYFKIAEKNPKILKTVLTSKKLESNYPTGLLPESKITPGGLYSVEDLIHYMIVYSDNDAAGSLLENQFMNENEFYRVYRDLNIYPHMDINNEDSMSVQTYASFFRILYNASYLSKDYSEMALKLLTQTQFDQGIEKPIPKSIKVAHKYGLRALQPNQIQLHDCGIIYYPNNPYLLCVMTRGSNFQRINEVIADISELVYKEIDNQFKNSQ